MKALAFAAVFVCAGCVHLDSGSDPRATPQDSAAKQRVEAALRPAVEKALTSGGYLPSVQQLDQDGRSSIVGTSAVSEQNFRCYFRLVTDAADSHLSIARSKALPTAEYPRVIYSIYADTLAAMEAGGGKRIESLCDSTTFRLRYEATDSRGRRVTGTIRGRVGPEDTEREKPPEADPYYTVISVDIKETTEKK